MNETIREKMKGLKTYAATRDFIQHFVQGDHQCRGSIEACQAAGNGECIVCGARDCSHDEPLHYHHDGCPACVFDEAKSMTPDQKKLEIAVKALQFYAQQRVYVEPEDWDCAKQGGAPKIENYERCDGVAEAALHDMDDIDGGGSLGTN